MPEDVPYLRTLDVLVDGRRPGRAAPTVRATPVRVSEGRIEADGHRPILSASIARVYYQPRAVGRGTVRCIGPFDRVLFEAEVDSEEEADAFLRALGRDVSRHRLVCDAASPLATRTFAVLGVPCLTVLAATLGSATHLGVLLTTLLAVVMAFASLCVLAFPMRVEVASDGLLLRWLGTIRFVRYDAIDRITTRDRRTIEIVRTDGQTLRVALGAHGRAKAGLEAAALQARIEEARRVHTSARSSGALAARMERGGRTLTAWRSHLEAVRAENYRHASVRDEDIWRVLEDPTAPEDARAGAASLLRATRASEPEGMRLRIAAAAETVASPLLRVAIERAADPGAEDRDVEEALARLAAPSPS